MITERLSSGIPDLDLILGGGVSPGSLLIIAGAPGTGKTILAQQMCFANASPDRKALYYTTLSEPHSKLIRHLEQFEFFDAEALGKRVEFIHLPDLARRESVHAVTAEVVRKSFETQPVIVVIDSARALHDFTPPEALREIVYDLASRVAHTDAVLVFVGEYTEEDLSTAPEFAVADGILQLVNESQGSLDSRWLRVVKMRGAGHISGRHTLRIGVDGIEVFPRIEAASLARAEAPGVRVPTGIRGLDEMTAGGYPAGSATLVAGPAGSGKTILGLHFVADGLARGERCLFVSFQETERQLAVKASSFGWDLSKSLADRKLIIGAFQPVEMVLDVLAADLAKAAGDGVSRVVVDSLNEIERAAQGSGRFASYLWSLVERFRAQGSTIVVTSETQAFFGPTFELARGVSFIVDNAILLRYAELESEIRRALSVVKMRDSDHVKSLVEFEIGNKGIHVKGKFAGLGGVLTGTPTRTEERFKEFFNR